MIYFTIYLLGSIATLFILHKWREQLDLPDYDSEKDYSNYDDWTSNAQAFAGYSVVWPLFWGVRIPILLWDLLVYISGIIENKLKK